MSIAEMTDAEAERMEKRLASTSRAAAEPEERPMPARETKRWGETSAVWTFNTTNTVMRMSFAGQGIPLVDRISVAGALYTDDTWNLKVGHRELREMRGTIKWSCKVENVKEIIFTPNFGAARVGQVRIYYYGADNQIDCQTVGTSAVLPPDLQEAP